MRQRLFQKLFFTFFLLACFTVPAVSGELDRFSTLQGEIDIAGGTAHIPVMKDAAKIIMTSYPQINITVAGGGSGVGVQKVGEGLVDIGNAGRPVSEKEREKYSKLRSFPFAIDGVAPVVNPANPISGLTSVQIQDVFSGKINNWKYVGGDDVRIHIYSRDEASGTRSVFWKKCLNRGVIVESANIVASNGAMKVAVSQDRYALGYMSIGHLDNTVKAIKLNGVAPTQDNAINGSYPVVRKLFMNTNGAPKPLVQAFIDYVLSSEGAGNISGHGYIPLR
ncbi:MAG: phosphate ABC transporter substrate-binding protein [Thermodesulfobacteriota bacterium]|nr:phosphate ABC transporter substrate-binding protein [Thermodesulfobacteriota bacterium]